MCPTFREVTLVDLHAWNLKRGQHAQELSPGFRRKVLDLLKAGRTVQQVAEVRPDYPTEWTAINAVAAKLCIGTAGTLRKCVRQAQIDEGTRPGTTSDESAELKRLRRENAELRRANEVLKAASVCSRGGRFVLCLDDDVGAVSVEIVKNHHTVRAGRDEPARQRGRSCDGVPPVP